MSPALRQIRTATTQRAHSACLAPVNCCTPIANLQQKMDPLLPTNVQHTLLTQVDVHRFPPICGLDKKENPPLRSMPAGGPLAGQLEVP